MKNKIVEEPTGLPDKSTPMRDTPERVVSNNGAPTPFLDTAA